MEGIVKIYNNDLIVQGMIRAESVQFTRRFYAVGGFEIHLSKNSCEDGLLAVDNIVCVGKTFGIIENIFIDEDVMITGPCLKGLAARRIVLPPFLYEENPTPMDGYERIKASGEQVMKFFVRRHLTQPMDIRRSVDRLDILNPQMKRGKEDVAWQSKFERLDTVLEQIGRFSGLGWDIAVNPYEQRMEFDVYLGNNRCTQSEIDLTDYAPCLFAERMGTMNKPVFESVYSQSSTVGYALGDGEEELQYVERMGLGDGFGLRECSYFVGNDYTPEEFSTFAFKQLEEHLPKVAITAEATNRLKYREDWDLGDYVTISFKVLGETLVYNSQITEVREVYERGNVKVIPTFGERADNLFRRLIKI